MALAASDNEEDGCCTIPSVCLDAARRFATDAETHRCVLWCAAKRQKLQYIAQRSSWPSIERWQVSLPNRTSGRRVDARQRCQRIRYVHMYGLAVSRSRGSGAFTAAVVVVAAVGLEGLSVEAEARRVGRHVGLQLEAGEVGRNEGEAGELARVEGELA